MYFMLKYSEEKKCMKKSTYITFTWDCVDVWNRYDSIFYTHNDFIHWIAKERKYKN